MSDPRPVSDGLAAARRSMIRTSAPEPDPAEIELARARGMAAMAEARWSSIIPSRFCRATFEGIADEAARRLLADWSAQTRPANVVLLGPVGTGKTCAAVASVRPAFDRACEVMFAPIEEMLNLLRPDGDRNALADLCDVDRLIIDDLGAERQTEWTTAQLGLVINRRWMEERATVVTSNLQQGDLERHLGGHTASRLLGGAHVVLITGKDRRRAP